MANKTKGQSVPESYRNSGQPWTEAQVNKLRQLARENTPTRVIGLKLGRSPRAIQSKASEAGISLMPPNRSPFSRTGRGSKSSGSSRGSGQRRRSAKTTSARRRQ